VALVLIISLQTFLFRGGWLPQSYPNGFFSILSGWILGIVLLAILTCGERGVRNDSFLFRCIALGIVGLIIGYFWTRFESIFPSRLTDGNNLNRQVFFLGSGMFVGVATGFMRRKKDRG
jgi:hypothetical protein